MRLTQTLNKHILGRWYNDIWKQKKNVTIRNHKLKQALEAEGKEVFDATELFASDFKAKKKRFALSTEKPPPPPPPPSFVGTSVRQLDEHETPAYMYSGLNMMLGQRQAQALTNTIQVGEGLPERITALEGLEKLKNQDELVTDVIKTSLMFDATQEKLPKVIDITRLGLPQPLEWGIPEARANRCLLSGLLSLCERLSGRLGGYQSRMVLHRPHLQATNATPGGHRLVVQRRPELALLCDRPLAPVAPPDAVQASREAAAPDLTPVSPYVHLPRHTSYQWADVPPVSAGCKHPHVHTLLVSWNGRLKKYANDDQLGALALMCMYAAALNMARQQSDAVRPVLVQCVATDGRLFKPAVLQLNTADLPEPTGGGEVSTRHQIKNMLWTEPAAALFQFCGYREGRAALDGYNPELFPRLLAMYMDGLLSRTLPEL